MYHLSLLLIGAAAVSAVPYPQDEPPEVEPAVDIECPAFPDPLPSWDDYPIQATLPDPFLPLGSTLLSSSDSSTFADDVMSGRGANRVQSPEEWYQCRRPEIIKMLQEYQFGYYPDHSLEEVTATRSGDNIAIRVTADGKTGSFSASVQLPAGEGPHPVVINIGGMQNQQYLSAGIAVAQFDYTRVAADSNSKTGAFWDIYNGRDIGVLTAWAWGFHRTLDGINMTVPEIDPTRVGVTGCSRLGKGALAAGLFDERITVTMPMSAGIQGIGPYRYHAMSGQDETLENSKQGAPWWSADTLGTFMNHHENLPFDAHTIAAAIAPRALVIDQGEGDPYVNSKGTAVVVYPAVKAVYDFLDAGDNVAMGIRSGGHCDMAGFSNILPFVEKVFFGKDNGRDWNDLSPWTAMPETYPWATEIPSGGA